MPDLFILLIKLANMQWIEIISLWLLKIIIDLDRLMLLLIYQIIFVIRKILIYLIVNILFLCLNISHKLFLKLSRNFIIIAYINKLILIDLIDFQRIWICLKSSRSSSIIIIYLLAFKISILVRFSLLATTSMTCWWVYWIVLFYSLQLLIHLIF